MLVLIAATFLRLYRYDLPDVINDEVFYGFRSIGLIDYLNSPYQPTPFEWFDPIPAWAKISFHDHPILGFVIQNIFFKIFGVNLLGLRLPFILAGIASVYLIYLVCRRLFENETTGLLAAAVLAVNNYHIWISRIGLQESLVIFFWLVAIWLFLKTLENFRYFYWTVAAVGFAILIKYTAVVLLPIFGVFLLLRRRDLLTWPRVIWASVILLAIVSPIIIYNLNLYALRGHFDYQISYFLGQNVPEWQFRTGREAPGGFVQRFQSIFLWFREGYGLPFTALFAVSLAVLLRSLKNWGAQFLGLSLLFITLLLFVIGPENRFFSVTAPFFAAVTAFGISKLFSGKALLVRAGWGILIVFLAWESFYSINTYLAVSPLGREVWHYSRLRRDANSWGYNQLEEYLNKTMAGYYPSLSFPLRYSFAKTFGEEARRRAKRDGKSPREILFIYDTSFFNVSSLWYLTRRTIYDAWPVITDGAYLSAVSADPGYFKNQGIKEFVFLKAGDTLLDLHMPAASAVHIETDLQAKNLQPEIIKSKSGKNAFRVYKF